jgi:hypothetical protein
MSRIFLAFVTITFSGFSFGQGQEVRPVVSGDVLTYEASNAKQIGNEPFAFPEKNVRVNKITIEQDGSRNYVFGKSGQPHSVRDKLFTMVSSGGKQVENGERFQVLPADQSIREWDLPAITSSSPTCGSYMVNYHAVKQEGPEITLMIDGKEMKIKTTSINYKATPSSGQCGSWNLEKNILYSEQLGEMISESYMNTQNGFHLNIGWKWTLKSIKTAPAAAKLAEAAK